MALPPYTTRADVYDIIDEVGDAQKNVPGGIVGLDENGKIPPELLTDTAGFGGEINPADNPAPTEPTYYTAGSAGTYTNAGGIVVSAGDMTAGWVQLAYNGATWAKNIVAFDLTTYAKKDLIISHDLVYAQIADLTGTGLTINSVTPTGNVDATIAGGRLYPWLTMETDQIQFVLDAQAKYLIVAMHPSLTSILAITLDPTGSSGKIYRFTSVDGVTPADTVPPNVIVQYGSLITVRRVGTIITVNDDGADVITYNYGARPEPEWAHVLFGNVVTANGVQVQSLKLAKDVNKIDVLEGEVDNLEVRVAALENANDDINIFTGQNYASLGDSIDANLGTQNILRTELGIASFQTLAVSGSTIVNTNADSIINKVAQITGSPKLITMGGSTNDFGTNVVLGTIDSTVNTTFYGALKIIGANLTTTFPNSEIFWFGILIRDWLSGGQVAGQENSNGNTIYQFANAMKEVANLYGIHFVDLTYLSGINLKNITTTTSDRLHPTTLGHQMRAEAILDYMRTIYL